MKRVRLSQLALGTIYYYVYDYYRIENKLDEGVLCYCLTDGCRYIYPSTLYVRPLTKEQGKNVLSVCSIVQ